MKIDKIFERITKLEAAILSRKQPTTATDVKPESTATDTCINGINVMRIPLRDAYSFALQLLDFVFSKEEQAGSLLFKSKKTTKPALDSKRVQNILSLVDRRYGGDNWDLKTLSAKVNQKCRDLGVKKSNKTLKELPAVLEDDD